MQAPLVRYQSVVADSARWKHFAFRRGDIVISAPIKCGTTWVQMICALLIFQKPMFPSTLDRISPWLDTLMRPLAEVLNDLEAQKHRRFVKSHTPLDGLPFEEDVIYICVGRDPRDVALSLDNHMSNLNVNKMLSALGLGHLPELTPDGRTVRSGSERERFWLWVDATSTPGLKAMVHHLTTFWEARERQNVVLLHYDDLKANLQGQMRHLAGRLDLGVPEELWPGLVRAATFEEMRRRADEIVPNSNARVWHDNARFFNKGTSGQWKHLLSNDELRRYQTRIMEFAAPDLAAWIHRGPIVAS
jgi:aryl sulfotransferase